MRVLHRQRDVPPKGEADCGGVERVDPLPQSVQEIATVDLFRHRGSVADASPIFPEADLVDAESRGEEDRADVAAAPRKEAHTSAGVAQVEPGDERRAMGIRETAQG